MGRKTASNGYQSYILKITETSSGYKLFNLETNDGKIIDRALLSQDIAKNGKDGDIVDINDVGYLFHQDEDTLQLVMTFASLDRIHSAVIHNMEWKITFWWQGELKTFSFPIWKGYENLRAVRDAFVIKVHDDVDPTRYRKVEFDVHVEKGGKLKGDKEDNVLVGTLGDDKIIGKAGDDILHGDDISKTVWVAGDDKLYGGKGHDKLYGYRGSDKLYGGDGHDLLDGGHGRDVLYGDGGNDTLNGSWGHDTLYGGTGDDLLVGGFGNDVLTGGQGKDIFVLEDPLSHAANFFTRMTDTVTDFDIGVDKIRVYQEWIDKGWVSIDIEEYNSGKYQLGVTVKKTLSDAEYLYLQEHGELPPQAKTSVSSKMLLSNIAEADLIPYLEDDGTLGLIDSTNMLLDIV